MGNLCNNIAHVRYHKIYINITALLFSVRERITSSNSYFLQDTSLLITELATVFIPYANSLKLFNCMLDTIQKTIFIILHELRVANICEVKLHI